ncbi:hypothetical protein Goari_022476 [Gossypium aridum]|uniref:Uncharacterized protein n=1 Tax=Gossypium aridum TaxID=34290 RepID=A0A7J8YSP9_GOSAI|nr:hypothetical protein [Gossypium aridum]
MFFRDKILNQSGQSKPLGESLEKDIELMEGDVTDNNGGIPSSNFSNQCGYYGHLKEGCLALGIRNNEVKFFERKQPLVVNIKNREEEESYGSWMVRYQNLGLKLWALGKEKQSTGLEMHKLHLERLGESSTSVDFGLKVQEENTYPNIMGSERKVPNGASEGFMMVAAISPSKENENIIK